MTEIRRPFAEEIAANKMAEAVSPETVGLMAGRSVLDVRLRGAFITRCDLTSPLTGQTVPILFQDSDLAAPKPTAAHAMLPAGPSDGIGGQHGFPRWADYHAFPVVPGKNGRDRLALQAMRSDDGLAISRIFELSESAMTITNRVHNPGQNPETTSIGEHLYFDLPGGDFESIRVDGKSIEELMGPGSNDVLYAGDTLFYRFGGETVIEFPAGHAVRLSTEFEGDTNDPAGLWIWKKQPLPGQSVHPSICFEPVVGVAGANENDPRDGVRIEPQGTVALTTTIELL